MSPVNASRASDLDTTAFDSPGFTDSLAEARDKLVEAASAAGNALRAAAGGAVAVARDELTDGGEQVRDSLTEAADASRQAALTAKLSAEDRVDDLVAQGRQMLRTAEDFVRERPVASLGIAVATGYVVAKLLRRRRRPRDE